MHNKNILKKIIKCQKPIDMEKYINFCLYNKDGYYVNSKIIGKEGDFVTAPEISQLFGELIGLFIFSFWKENINKKFNLVELGPGKGTLLIDILSITKSFNNFQQLINIFLIEKNKKLIKNQINNIKKYNFDYLNIKWSENFITENKYPTIIYANEFFDCLPIRQFYNKNNYLYEKKIIYNEAEKKITQINDLIKDKNLISKVKKYEIKNVLETSDARDKYFNKICNHIKIYSGMIIVVDYGYYEKPNYFTLQAIYNNKKSNVLDNIGYQDITSLVDFQRMVNLAKSNSLKINLFSTQRDFLIKYGIHERAEKIIQNISQSEKKKLKDGLLRLVDEKNMGSIFKVLVISK
jgi:NADH dehydrogenase [ubiquinone] 1 alpha subcomplex assembly factor 7